MLVLSDVAFSQSSLMLKIYVQRGNTTCLAWCLFGGRYMMLHNRVDQARSLIRNERYTLKSATPFHWAIDNFYGEIFLALLAKPGAKRLLVQGQAVQRLLMKVAELRVFSTEKALVLDKCLVAAAKLLGGASMATILFTVSCSVRCSFQRLHQ